MREETSLGGTRGHFQSTRWTNIRHARDGSPEHLSRLVSDYWKPIYFFIRRKGRDVEAAKDLTQSFLAALLEKDYLRDVAPERGKFRSFVMAAVSHFLSDERDRARALKRGGGHNFVQAEADLASADPSPEKAFFRAWALEVVERAKGRLRVLLAPEDLDLLEGVPRPDLSPDDRKNRGRRAREGLREALRQEIAPLVESDGDIEGEIDELFAALE